MFYELRSTQVMSFVGIFNILWEVLALFKYPNNEWYPFLESHVLLLKDEERPIHHEHKMHPIVSSHSVFHITEKSERIRH